MNDQMDELAFQCVSLRFCIQHRKKKENALFLGQMRIDLEKWMYFTKFLNCGQIGVHLAHLKGMPLKTLSKNTIFVTFAQFVEQVIHF